MMTIFQHLIMLPAVLVFFLGFNTESANINFSTQVSKDNFNFLLTATLMSLRTKRFFPWEPEPIFNLMQPLR